MKEVVSQCSNCGDVVVRSGWRVVLRGLGRMFVALLVTLGFVFVLFISYVGLPAVQDSFLHATYENRVGDFFFDYRSLAVNMSEGHGCGDSDSCYVSAIFEGTADIPYVPCGVGVDTLYPPAVVMQGGDCKNTAYLFTELVRSVGVVSYLRCSNVLNHCVSEVRLADGRVWGVDLTIPLIYDVTSSGDVFDNSVVVYYLPR